MHVPLGNRLVAAVDDEPDILELVALHLKGNGFQVKTFEDPKNFLSFLRQHTPDLAILDLMLPGTDGFELCKFMKRDQRLASVPVIMLTAKNDITDKVLGLELGADDYITKPFSPKELIARVKVVLRRHTTAGNAAPLDIGGTISILPENYEVLSSGKKIALTATEFKILHLLASRKGHVFTRAAILDALWGEDTIVVDRTIDVHIRHLREKLGAAGRFIESIRSIGYRIDA